MAEPEIPSSADVVIVGAGVAGLYCAYRLLQDDPKRSVVVFDLLDHIGGRLDTDIVRIKDLDGKIVEVKEEEGGMRFNQSMTELLALIHSLEMDEQIVPFGMGDDNNYFHIRGRSFTFGEAKQNNNAIWKELYNLYPNEQNKSPVDILTAVPPPVLTSFRLWCGEHEFGYAYHQWARFADDREVMKTIASPVENLYICNEAFSDEQGWVNGSLRSANRVLEPHFHIGPLPPAPR